MQSYCLPLCNLPVWSTEHGTDLHLKHTERQQFLTTTMCNFSLGWCCFPLFKCKKEKGQIVFLYFSFTFGRLKHTVQPRQKNVRTTKLTSIFCQQQQVALQHWSPVSFLVEELGKATEKTQVCVLIRGLQKLPDGDISLLLTKSSDILSISLYFWHHEELQTVKYE